MHNPDQNLPSSETLIYVCNEEVQGQGKNIRDQENLPNLESSLPEGAPGSLQSPKVQFPCHLCHQNFSRKSLLKLHRKSHQLSKPYNCKECSSGFNNLDNFLLHMVTHKTPPVRCPTCKVEFQRRSSIRGHIKLHFKSENLTCAKCEGVFSFQMDLQEHSQQCLGKERVPAEKPFECSVCQKNFGKKSVLNRHLLIHTGKKPFRCDICRQTFTQKSSLVVHKVIHTGDRPHQCPKCSLSFIQKTNLQCHLKRLHSSESQKFPCKECSCSFRKLSALSLHCTICPMRFTKNCHLREHLMRHQNIRPFQCAICGKTFATRTILEVHGRCHTGQKPFCCLMCDRMFTTASACRRHAEVHSVEKKYECQKCRKRFKTQESFRKHSIIHDGMKRQKPPEEEYILPSLEPIALPAQEIPQISEKSRNEKNYKKCPNCSKKFIKPIDLRRHLRTHTGERPFHCDECGKSFSLESTLRNHRRIHSNDKPKFTCVTCLKDFSSKDNLKTHLTVHTGVKSFECLYCDKRFRTLSNRNAHHSTHLKKINSTIQAEAENSRRTVPSSREVLSSPETLTEDPENPENLPPLIPIQSQTL
uniref:C2H2-type domain-containing protein n=1 Tax=Phlebotomus papatasi TaxID=29031 RepID=A0A1B0D5J8_PHLPP